MKTFSFLLRGALVALTLGSAFGSSQLLPQFPATDGGVNAIAVDASRNRLYIVGEFTTVGGVARKGAAALELSTGALLPWNPGVEGGTAGCLAVSPETGVVYLGGGFNKVGGLQRIRLAAVRSDGGLVPNWNPSPDLLVTALAVESDTLYVGGYFSNVGQATVGRLAALNATTAEVRPAFLPQPNNVVTSLISAGSVVYAGGGFTTIGGGMRTSLAALQAGTGSLVAGFTANADGGQINDMVRVGGVLYGAGNISSINGMGRFGAAAVSTADGSVQPWNPNPNSTPGALAAGGSNIYIGGGFALINGTPRTRLAAVNNSSAAVSNWAPVVDDYVFALAVSGSTVFVGGNFTTVNGVAHRGFAAINDSDLGPALAPVPPTIRNGSRFSIKTKKKSVTLRGTSQYATAVKYRLGKSGDRSAKGTAASWSVPAKVKVGKTIVFVRAQGLGGTSRTLKFTIRRSK